MESWQAQNSICSLLRLTADGTGSRSAKTCEDELCWVISEAQPEDVLVWHRLMRTGVELSSIPGFFNEIDSYAMKLPIIRPGGMALRNAMGVAGCVDSMQNG